ncbi:MAG: hypothetical protein A2Y33_12415 [Spirochaetes bacterium GWF1_51_8]|nr:MAG: hypothetical protein A2Y33_12415 [Spirochaetes bacterium GWF1_51_8]
MKKVLFSAYFAILTLIFIPLMFPLEVSLSELKNVQSIKFENYPGSGGSPQSESTVAEIKGIGQLLAQGVTKQKNNTWYPYLMKYSIIHAYSKGETNKLAADIFSIDKDAKVDHVKNIKRILAGYLEGMYNYSEKHSKVLAIFILYYNAVYRGNIDYFASKYKTVVLKHITKADAGIAVKYSDWPGKTKMLIPLTEDAERDSLNSLDSSIISDDKVIEAFQKLEDMGIDERKDIVELKEEQVVEKKEEIDKTKEDIEKKKDEIKEEEKKLQEEKDKIKKKEDEIKKDKEKIDEIKDPKDKEKKKEEIKKKEDEIKKDKDTVKKDETKLDEEKKEIVKKEDEIKKEEKEIVKKEDEIKKDKELIKEDEKKIEEKKKDDSTVPPVDDKTKLEEEKKKMEEEKKKMEEEKIKMEEKQKELDEREDELKQGVDDKVFDGKFYYLKIKDYLPDGVYQNELFIINAGTRKVEVKCPYDTISGSKYSVFKNGVVVIGFEGQELYNHKLILLDRYTLEPVSVSADFIFWRSFVEIRDDFIYALVMNQGKYYLGKFDEKLNKVAQSSVALSKDTFLTFYKDYVYINDEAKKIAVLNITNLKLIETIEP